MGLLDLGGKRALVTGASQGIGRAPTKGMATDWPWHRLQGNAMAPGYFDTPLHATLVAAPSFTEWLEKRMPAGRWGRVEDLVEACVVLASSASSCVNGQCFLCRWGITALL